VTALESRSNVNEVSEVGPCKTHASSSVMTDYAGRVSSSYTERTASHDDDIAVLRARIVIELYAMPIIE